MFGLQFLFAAGLWALPLAGLPVLLHLFFRQKSAVVPFSTLRFIKLSMQKTAARRRVQKWLLLACRTLLIALLIWAIAQPAKKLASSWLGSGKSAAAVIVVDTSYSMQIQEGQATLLSKADGMVQDLLRGQLSAAKVAVFQSMPNKNSPEQLQDAAAILAEWSPLKPQANPKPLIDRVESAIALLERQPAEQKWLLVLSDFQSKEFGRSIRAVEGGHTILIDLHPAQPRSAGVTRVGVTPLQPIPGVASEAVVEVAGRAGDDRAVILKTTSVDGSVIGQSTPSMANFDSSGRGVVRFPLKLPGQRWVLLTAMLATDDAMMWDNQRSQLIEIPPKQLVTIISNGLASTGQRFVRLALDPNEGKLADWPVNVSSGSRLTGQENVAVTVLSKWPDAREASALRDFARGGRNVVLFLQPGLEESWKSLDPAIQSDLLELLPSMPLSQPAELRRVVVTDPGDPLLEGLTDEKFQLNAITVRQMVAFSGRGSASAVLSATAVDPLPGSRPMGLLFRKPVGAGVCYTIATSPESAFTNFATHPTFLPLLVRMALVNPNQSKSLNVELGQPLVLEGSLFPAETELQIQSPSGAVYRVKGVETDGNRKFIFSDAAEPGIYTWKKVVNDQILTMTNVQLPAGESDLTYRPAASVDVENVVVANSINDLQLKLGKLNEPQPQWSIPIAIVLMLLCFEALMGSMPKMGKARELVSTRAA
jgi:hypothetical protein